MGKCLKYFSFLLVLLLVTCQLHSPQKRVISFPQKSDPPFIFKQIKTDTLFNSPQIISILRLAKKDSLNYYFDLAHHSNDLKKTSQFASEAKALAAINGGFFNMDKGGSVTYLEEQDSVFQRNIPHGNKWAIADWAKTGALIIKHNGQLKLEPAKDQSFYEHSNQETGVLITGPFLLDNGQKKPLINAKFVTDRHPRSCICETPTAYLLLTIDGRQAFAAGMSLLELQTFLLQQKCRTAINLDGGGSTTMWLRDTGVVNQPSDFFGERKVANALLVKAY